MTDGKPNRRISQLERKVHELELLIGQPRQNDQTGIGEQKNPSQEGQETPWQSSIIPPAPANRKNPKKASDQSAPWWKRCVKKVIGLNWWRILEGLGIVSVIAYASVTYLQWHDLRHNFEVDQRAWVKIGYIWPNLTPDQTAVMNGNLVNFGKSTITWLMADGIFEVVKVGDSPSFSLEQRHSTTSQAPFFPGDSSTFPIQLFDRQTKKPRAFTPQEIDDLTAGRAYAVTFGWIAYGDQFGHHWYRFCGWRGYAPVGWANASKCVEWNRVGDGKPDIPIE